MQKIVNGEVIEMTEEEVSEYLLWVQENAKQSKTADVRDRRNALLTSTDWTQVTDVPQAIKDKYATYRQALRDVPQQEGFPDNIVWPTQPE